MYFYDRASMQEHHQVGGGLRYVACGERMMMLLELPPGATVPTHGHPHEQLGIVLEGEFELVVGSERRHMQAGDMHIIPGGVPHQAVGSEEKARFFDVWSPPRETLLDGPISAPDRHTFSASRGASRSRDNRPGPPCYPARTGPHGPPVAASIPTDGHRPGAQSL